MMITNNEKCRKCLPLSERKDKMVQNKGNIGASDSQPMHRSADYGHVGDDYHHNYFPN